jgi:hypothetical protein
MVGLPCISDFMPIFGLDFHKELPPLPPVPSIVALSAIFPLLKTIPYTQELALQRREHEAGLRL